MLKQSLNFKLSQKLSPQQIQLMKMIQLPTQAFEERLKQEIEENPALDTGKEETDDFEENLENEFDDDGTEKIATEDINIDDYLSDDEIPNYKTQANNYSSDDEEKQVPYAAGKTFHQSLREQLNTFSLNEEDNAIAEFLVGSIDDSGYLRRDLADLVDDLAFTQNVFTTVDKIENVLVKVVQALDPIGVGARDLKECLIIQLKSKSSTDVRVLAISVLETAFDKFVKKHYSKLLEKFDINEEE
ncbi:MAG: RNA polymerase sigma-54 factor, partial [Flavobacteriaceae bacterium]|nr:RNA polymerase sigma-54 factor [Flavobacteriaceae bacterium]